MRVNLAAGFVLHRRAYRDSSLLVEAFTREYGRIALIARGARRARSRDAAALQSIATPHSAP